jgi:hypothetical protein
MSEIENNIRIPENSEAETRKLKAKAPRKTPRERKKAQLQNPAIGPLLESLKFVAQVQKKSGTAQQQFCAVSGGWVVASNGICTLAAPIELDLQACLHTMQMTDALSKCGQELSIAQLSPSAVSVNSENFKALVACESFENLEFKSPDENTFELSADQSEAFCRAVSVVQGLSTEGASFAHNAGVFIGDEVAVATNGAALIESWHGVPLPYVIVPKSACAVLARLGDQICGFGYSGPSCTFWLRNGGFVQSALFAEAFPPYSKLFDVSANPWTLPLDFFKAVHAVEDFSKTGIVYFDNGFVSSREKESDSTTYKIEGLPNAMAFNAKNLSLVESVMAEATFDTGLNKCVFFGAGSRGVLMGVDLNESSDYNNQFDEEIPF